MSLGWLNFKNSNSLALSCVKLGLDGAKLNLQRFCDRMDLSLGLLVNTGAGLSGKGRQVVLNSFKAAINQRFRSFW